VTPPPQEDTSNELFSDTRLRVQSQFRQGFFETDFPHVTSFSGEDNTFFCYHFFFLGFFPLPPQGFPHGKPAPPTAISSSLFSLPCCHSPAPRRVPSSLFTFLHFSWLIIRTPLYVGLSSFLFGRAKFTFTVTLFCVFLFPPFPLIIASFHSPDSCPHHSKYFFSLTHEPFVAKII